MTARRCIFAWTKNEPNDPLYPEFISINREEDGRLTIAVRGPRRQPQTDDNPHPFTLAGRQVEITLPDDQIGPLWAALEDQRQ